MRRVETSLPGVFELPTVFEDTRASFMETYHQEKFTALGITDHFVQDHHSRSAKGTLRGLHYQLHHAQAKLCRVVEGEALGVAVDIRLGSPTFGKWTCVTLSAQSHNLIYIPPGFAHGFLALTDAVREFYDRDDERGILWSDPQLNIAWGIAAPLISEKDAKFPRLVSVPREFLPHFRATSK